jgi:hypothetical protein
MRGFPLVTSRVTRNELAGASGVFGVFASLTLFSGIAIVVIRALDANVAFADFALGDRRFTLAEEAHRHKSTLPRSRFPHFGIPEPTKKSGLASLRLSGSWRRVEPFGRSCTGTR